MINVGEYIKIRWDECKPFSYGLYTGILKSGEYCTIDIDWKIMVMTESRECVGTNQIECWLCDARTLKSLIHQLERYTDPGVH